jgi:hypothetical protein
MDLGYSIRDLTSRTVKIIRRDFHKSLPRFYQECHSVNLNRSQSSVTELKTRLFGWTLNYLFSRMFQHSI